MNDNTKFFKFLLACMFGCVLITQAACGPNVRQKTLTVAMTSLSASADGFVAWDKAHQDAIVAAATSKEDGLAKLTAYKTARDAVIELMGIAYQAIADVALHKDKPIATAITAATAAKTELDKLKAAP